jgi:hypothetical protein
MALRPGDRHAPFADARLSPRVCTHITGSARRLDSGDPFFKHYKLRFEYFDGYFGGCKGLSKEIAKVHDSYGSYYICVSFFGGGVWACSGWCCERCDFEGRCFTIWICHSIYFFRDRDRCVGAIPGWNGTGLEYRNCCRCMVTTLVADAWQQHYFRPLVAAPR